MLPGDKIISALPDWSGRIWFASVQGRGRDDRPGQRRGRAPGARRADLATRSRSTRDGGVYIVTDTALYRFERR